MLPFPCLLRNTTLNPSIWSGLNISRVPLPGNAEEVSARVFLLSVIEPRKPVHLRIIVNNCGSDDIFSPECRIIKPGYIPAIIKKDSDQKRKGMRIGEKWDFECALNPATGDPVAVTETSDFIAWQVISGRGRVIPSKKDASLVGLRKPLSFSKQIGSSKAFPIPITSVEHFAGLGSEGPHKVFALIGPRGGKSSFVNACQTRYSADLAHDAIVCEKIIEDEQRAYSILGCRMSFVEVPTWTATKVPEPRSWVYGLFVDGGIFFWDGGDTHTRQSMIPYIAQFLEQRKAVFILCKESQAKTREYELRECGLTPSTNTLVFYLTIDLSQRQAKDKSFASDLEVARLLAQIRSSV